MTLRSESELSVRRSNASAVPYQRSRVVCVCV